MTIKKATYLMIMTLFIAMVFPAQMLAEPIGNISKEEAKAQETAEEISTDIDLLVSNINGKYQKLAKLDEKISDSEQEIKKTKVSIEETQTNIDKRMDVVGEQLQTLQLQSVGTTKFGTLLSANSFNDFFNRMYAISVLGSAQKEKIETLDQDRVKLENLEKDLTITKTKLEEQKDEAKTEEDGLDDQLSGLQSKLAVNGDLLQKYARERVEKENKKREEAIKKAEENNGKGSKDKGQDKGKDKEKPLPEPTPLPEEEPETPGSIMTGQATAYIATGNKTATGTVPGVHRTIAVDPSVIPLGSSVMIIVPGAPAYSGVYIAEDTGGVVHGNIIDIFVGSQDEAVDFGRQSIQFQIL